MKNLNVSKILKTAAVFGALVVTQAQAGVISDPENILPNVLVVRVPSQDGQVPNADTWDDDTKVEIIAMSMANLPVDESGQLNVDQFTTACQVQQPQVPFVMDSRGDIDEATPAEVRALFTSAGQAQALESKDLSARTIRNWYYYRPFRNGYGVYGYGYTPYYGYFGSANYYPNYGMYYHGRTYGFRSAGAAYWRGGYYHYPYYRYRH